MTDVRLIAIAAAIAAAMARIEGMKIVNECFSRQGYLKPYTEDYFFAEAELLQDLTDETKSMVEVRHKYKIRRVPLDSK